MSSGIDYDHLEPSQFGGPLADVGVRSRGGAPRGAMAVAGS